MSKFSFKINKNNPAHLFRVGTITTPHGQIKTPAFIAVGTKATLKALTVDQVKDTGAQALLANAYHLYLQPGTEVIKKAGGIGRFMNWDRPTFTDSGGFQVLSLGAGFKKTLALEVIDHDINDVIAKKGNRLAKVNDEGVYFKSHIDGGQHIFTPEISMQVQHDIGADIIFAFDECTSIMHPKKYQKVALERTHKWALRCLAKHQELNQNDNQNQALYGVIQGANYEDLRREAASYMAQLEFDGYGIGGAIQKSELAQMLQWVNELLPPHKPRHLLGLSEPDDIFIGIENGIDTFDCVAPARIARNASLYTPNGKIIIRKNLYSADFDPPVKDCGCYTCQNYSRAYLNHLFRSKERLAATLATIHNEYFIIHLVEQIRESIINDNFFEFKKSWLAKYYTTG
ncbi:tRNA guanosine(34) transglycosylase Tgt [Candidatus Saccharibacteria bacterium]|nr:tRNA guanosine(34) transglycosylase Tgt [Candidatus Saccharibacteria bacterium]